MEHIIYTSEVLGSLHWLFRILMIVGWMVLVIFLLSGAESGMFDVPESNDKGFRLTLRISGLVAIISTLLFILVPSKELYLRMQGEKIMTELEENSYWKKELPSEIVVELEKWIKENNHDSSL